MTITLTTSIVTSLAGETPINLSPGAQTITKNAVGIYSDILSCTVAALEHSTFGSLTTEGVAMVRNLDSTNFVQLGSATGDYFIKVKAGESFVFRLLPGATFWTAADTATVLMQLWVLED
jgi:hypothetical protein